MAKNIVIAEGGTAKNFTAKKLQTNLQGSGRVNWIPEDEAVDYVDIKDHTFRAAGTFKPEDFNCDGFGEVTIDIPADVKPKTITANGEYYAADDNCLGYSKVTVAVPGGGGGGPYTVRFFDDDRQTILKTDANVPYGGNASCTELDGTVFNGLYFKGWNPSPTNVKENMNCYPERGDYIIDANEIQDSWETICAVKGAGYPLGSYKALVFSTNAVSNFYPEMKNIYVGGSHYDGTRSGWNLYQINVTMHMVKVAEGEDGSTSTWLSTGVLDYQSRQFGSNAIGMFDVYPGNYYLYKMNYNVNGTNNMEVKTDWLSSQFRKYLNEEFIKYLPNPLPDSIVQVNKESRCFNIAPLRSSDTSSAQSVSKTSLDKIWIPSFREFHTKLAASTNYSNYSSYEEISGIDYTAVYVPTYHDGYILRTGLKERNNIVPIQFNESGNKIDPGNYYTKAPFGFCL